MEAFLSNLYAETTVPFLAALILGLMTAISPCPLATNITAMGYISRDITNRRQVFVQGLLYTAGRGFAYFFIAFLFVIGADQFEIASFLQKYGEKILGPLLIVMGVFMLGLIPLQINIDASRLISGNNKTGIQYLKVFLLGVLFALAFCPYSGVLYFGMLIPMSIQHPAGLYLPLVFAFATGIPVILFAWLIAYTVSGVGKTYNQLKRFEKIFRRIIALLFIGTGLYYILTVF